MRITNAKKVIAAMVWLAAVVTALALSLNNVATADSPPKTSSRNAVAMTSAVRPEATIRLAAPDTELLRGLREFDATFSPLAATAAEVARVGPATSLETASHIAETEVGFAGLGKPAEAMLGRVTLGQYGKELQPDPTLPSRIDPIVKDRPAWVLVFPSAEVPVFGPRESTDPPTVRQPVVAFVDSATGDFLGALSY